MTADVAPVDLPPGCAVPSGTIRVSGGRGGTSARLEDLRRAALELRSAADLLDDATATLATAERTTWAGPDALTAGQQARAAQAPLRRGPASTTATADRVRDLARSLDAAAETYAAAEHSAVSLVRGLTAVGATLLAETPLRYATGSLVVAGLTGAVVLEGAVHRATGRWVGPADLVRTGAAETLLHGVATYLRALRPGLQLPLRSPAGDLVAPLARHLGTGEVRVTALPPAPPVRLPLTQLLGVTPAHPLLIVPVVVPPAQGSVEATPRSAAAVLARVTTGYEGAPGTVEVMRLDHPDGTRSWVVAIPGTEDHRLVSPNPLGDPSNVRLIAGWTAASASLVVGALTQAGVRKDEPVMLAGHSQGGMAAVRVAADPAVRERFTITHVLTAGSPVAGMPVPPDVRVLSLEHTTDLVPVGDLTTNRDQPNHTTVRIDLTGSPDVADRLAARGVLDSHSPEAYARSAERVEELAGHHPSLQDWDESTEEQIYGEGATTTFTEYQGVNVPPGAGPGIGSEAGGGVVLARRR